MKTDFDALLLALYVFIDDQVVPVTRRRPGGPKRLSDSELVCLAVAQVLLGARSEHHWLRQCYGRLGHLFLYLPKQPGYHKRVKASAALITAATVALATQVPSFTDEWRLVDATPPLRDLSPDGQGFRAGRMRELWILRLAFALVLGPEALSGHDA
jgi:hypothetical protein